ncbi:MAG TPA: alpha/beta hydrolase [Legionella sp.]|nr:alpha/beta hydrolase [Legionella sp.]
MNHTFKALLFCFLFYPFFMCADSLKIDVEQASINLPYWPAKKAHYGAVLMINGESTSSTLLNQLANQLSRIGWSVVAINMDQQAAIPWIAQIPEVIRTLRQDHNKRIVMIHYGEHLNQTLEYFNKPQSKMINGLVMLSAFAQTDTFVDYNIRFPLLDILGQFDYEFIHDQRNLRARDFRRYRYSSIEMPGANHDYEYSKKLLFAYIHGWMSKLPEFKPQRAPISVSYIEAIPRFIGESFIVSVNLSGLNKQI